MKTALSGSSLREMIREVVREEVLEILYRNLPYVSNEESREIEEMFGKPKKEDLEPEREGLDWIGE